MWKTDIKPNCLLILVGNPLMLENVQFAEGVKYRMAESADTNAIDKDSDIEFLILDILGTDCIRVLRKI